MRPRPRRHALAAVGLGNGFVFANIRIKYVHCFFIQQFGDICVQIKHLRRRFPTVWAARHCSPGRTMMQNGPSDVAERAISQCQTAHIAVSDGPFCSAWRAQGPDGVARVAALRLHFLQGGLAVAAWRGLWPRGPAARCPAHNVSVFLLPGGKGRDCIKIAKNCYCACRG